MKINETFLSIQGEGKDCGILTYFVRFSGCNLRCSYCDTKYAYSDGRDISVTELARRVKSSGAKSVCITGGEPLLQTEIRDLTKKLIDHGMPVNLETNGSIPLPIWTKNQKVSVSMDLKCPSSGMSKKMILDNLKKLGRKDSVKFIIGDEIDYRFAKKWSKKIDRANVIFNPVFKKFSLRELAENVIRDRLNNVRIGVQLHKLIWGANKKGV